MREIVVIEVKDSNVLNFSLGNTPAGQPVTIPAGVSSITLMVRDTESFQQAKAKKADRKRNRARRRKKGGKGGPGHDDD